MTTLAVILIATVALCLGFAVVHAIARRIDNYGVVDIAWSYAFAGVVILYALVLPGAASRRALIAVMVVAWSARLGTHLLRRVMGRHPEEDGRYRRLRVDWGQRFARRMFFFFQLQAISVVVLSLPFLLASRNPAAGLHALEWTGLALWTIALAGESLADRQLHAFTRNPANRGRVCTEGLWRYSRHPNYFFEWLVWLAFFVFALPSPWGGLSVLSPAIILYLLLRGTGIPKAEEQAIRSKGDAYRRYQETTSVFIPLPPATHAHTGRTESSLHRNPP